jgi:hypothetical protein
VFPAVCPTHHREFDSGGFVFVPSERQRLSMLEYVEHDLLCERKALHRDMKILVGRSQRWVLLDMLCIADLLTSCHLKLINEFEYIPITTTPFFAPNPQPNSPRFLHFFFDNAERRPCPLLHFQAHSCYKQSAIPSILRTIFEGRHGRATNC